MVSPNRSAAMEQQFPCSLTFDHQLANVGKPLNTMKLDEFLNNVISFEEAQLLHHDIVNPSSSSSSASPFFFGNFDLSRKSVDEVWKEINIHQQQENINPMDSNRSVQRQIGETMLEDFLVRAGVINAATNQNGMINHHQQQQQQIMAIDPMVMVSQQSDWLQLQMAEAEQQQQMTVLDSNVHVSESVYENVGYAENQVSMAMPAISATSSESHAEKKRRYSDELMVKTTERRQKRMIKNRESAARSRARKQAYTTQMEHKVLDLKKKNALLKKLKEKETLLFSDPISMPIYQLRRTSSASF